MHTHTHMPTSAPKTAQSLIHTVHVCIHRNIVINKHTCRNTVCVCVCDKERDTRSRMHMYSVQLNDEIAMAIRKKEWYLTKSVLPLPLRNQSKIIHLHLEIFNMILFKIISVSMPTTHIYTTVVFFYFVFDFKASQQQANNQPTIHKELIWLSFQRLRNWIHISFIVIYIIYIEFGDIRKMNCEIFQHFKIWWLWWSWPLFGQHLWHFISMKIALALALFFVPRSYILFLYLIGHCQSCVLRLTKCTNSMQEFQWPINFFVVLFAYRANSLHGDR